MHCIEFCLKTELSTNVSEPVNTLDNEITENKSSRTMQTMLMNKPIKRHPDFTVVLIMSVNKSNYTITTKDHNQ